MISHAGDQSVLNVLLLEDQEADAELVLAELSGTGFDVRAQIARTRDEFNRILDASQFDVVVADYRLPGWTGMDALVELRKHGHDAPFILVTGSLGEERAVESLKRGAADYVLKDNLSRLSVAVRRALVEKRMQDEHQQHQALIRKLSLALDQSPASVIITDTSGAIEYVNQRFTEITGYSAEEVHGRNPRVLQSGRTSQDTYGDMWRTLGAGELWRGEILNRRKNGILFWSALTVSPVRGDDGAVTHYLGTQEDITPRKEAEAALRASEARFLEIADNIREVFFETDVALERMLYINKAYERVWGRSCESLYADPRSFLEPVVPEDRERFVAAIARWQKGEDAGVVEYRIVRPDGEVRWVVSEVVPIRNEKGEVDRLCGIAFDITERRREQEAREQSELRYRLITEASFDGISVMESGVFREANRGLCDILGYETHELIGRPLLDFVAEESLDEVRRRVSGGLEGTYQLVAIKKDGARVHLEVTARTMQGPHGTQRVTAVRDVTEKRRLQEQLLHAQKMEAVGRLAGGIAHDFNNLITVITAYGDLILQDLPPDDPHREDIELIRKAGHDAAALTRQLLAFSRKQIVEPRLVVLDNAVADAEKLLKRLVGEDVQVVAVSRPPAATILVDPGQLEQIIVNLAVNARDAMPTGGTLTIETSQVEFDDEYVRTHQTAVPGHYGLLAVTDTGIGMDEEVRARIFEPFFTTKEPGKGTGLGLATVYGIVKQNGGFIWVYSEPGLGSTFKVYLPLTEQLSIVPERVAAQSPESLRGSETILLVEDSPSVRAAARDALSRYGYTVLEAPNARRALYLASQHKQPIDLLLTDVVMPETSGRELAERLALIRPGTRVLFMSGYTDDSIVRHGVLASGIAYLQKPFTPATLALKVRQVLDSPGEQPR